MSSGIGRERRLSGGGNLGSVLSLVPSKVKKCLLALEELQVREERFKLGGGALVSALDKLESEFARLLLDNRSHPPIASRRKIRCCANDQLKNFISVYVETVKQWTAAELGGEATAPVWPNRASGELFLQRLGLGSGGRSLVSRLSSP
nr:exocyst complex component EXO70A1-like [Ipomoea batatas]